MLNGFVAFFHFFEHVGCQTVSLISVLKFFIVLVCFVTDYRSADAEIN